jgi:hypothetical protein
MTQAPSEASGGFFQDQGGFFHAVGWFFPKQREDLSRAEGGKYLQLAPIELAP